MALLPAPRDPYLLLARRRADYYLAYLLASKRADLVPEAIEPEIRFSYHRGYHRISNNGLYDWG